MRYSVEATIILTSWDSSQAREGSLDPTEGMGETPLKWRAATLVEYLEGHMTGSTALDSTAMLRDQHATHSTVTILIAEL